MTRKHYVAIAKILREVKEIESVNVEMYHSFVVRRLARYFASVNDLFDPARFIAACYDKENNND